MFRAEPEFYGGYTSLFRTSSLFAPLASKAEPVHISESTIFLEVIEAGGVNNSF